MESVLSNLARKYRTDKGPQYHNYTPVYEKYFDQIRGNVMTFLEIGLGNIESLNMEGESLKMWAEYFYNSRIVGIDIEDKSFLDDGVRVKTFKCDQRDEDGLMEIIGKIGMPHIIVDDASHINPFTIKTFNVLFPFLRPGGIYCIEDTVTSYWTAWEGEPDVLNPRRETVMSFFLNLCHYVNMKNRQNFHNPVQFYQNVNCYADIDSIHFHNSQIIIQKKWSST